MLKNYRLIIAAIAVVFAIITGVSRYRFISEASETEGIVRVVHDSFLKGWGKCSLLVTYTLGDTKYTHRVGCKLNSTPEVGEKVAVRYAGNRVELAGNDYQISLLSLLAALLLVVFHYVGPKRPDPVPVKGKKKKSKL